MKLKCTDHLHHKTQLPNVSLQIAGGFKGLFLLTLNPSFPMGPSTVAYRLLLNGQPIMGFLILIHKTLYF